MVAAWRCAWNERRLEVPVRADDLDAVHARLEDRAVQRLAVPPRLLGENLGVNIGARPVPAHDRAPRIPLRQGAPEHPAIAAARRFQPVPDLVWRAGGQRMAPQRPGPLPVVLVEHVVPAVAVRRPFLGAGELVPGGAVIIVVPVRQSRPDHLRDMVDGLAQPRLCLEQLFLGDDAVVNVGAGPAPADDLSADHLRRRFREHPAILARCAPQPIFVAKRLSRSRRAEPGFHDPIPIVRMHGRRPACANVSARRPAGEFVPGLVEKGARPVGRRSPHDLRHGIEDGGEKRRVRDLKHENQPPGRMAPYARPRDLEGPR